MRVRIAIDFSGIEAPIVALQQLGIQYSHEWSCEMDRRCQDMIAANHSPKIVFEDITTRNHNDLPEIDVYVAGFPCQTFSTLRKKKTPLEMTDSTIRANLSDHCIQTIHCTKPKVFILENVPHFMTFERKKGETTGPKFNNLIAELNRDDDYSIHYAILNTRDFGIPQNRRRLFIVGIRKDCQTKPFHYPEPHRHVPRLSAFLHDKTIHPLIPEKYPLKTRQRIFSQLPKNHSSKLFALKYHGGNGVSEEYAPCITRSCSIFITRLNRILTAREKVELQGFSVIDTNIVVSDSVLAKQAGNTMSVNVLKELFVNVFDCIH